VFSRRCTLATLVVTFCAAGLLAARRAGKPVTFVPADVNHTIAREKARKRGEPAPADLRGAAHGALASGG
jgi:hypothetical protein